MFSDKHQFLCFPTKEDRRKYWIGRLGQTKSTTRVDLFTVLPAKTLGMVIDLEDNNDGTAYVLVVRWATGATFPCYQYSIYSDEGGKSNDKV